MNIYKKCTAKLYSFSVIDTPLTSDNTFCFRRKLLERIQKVIMTNDDRTRDEKRQYDINRETTKLSTLTPSEIDKYEYLTGEEILPCNRSQIIAPANFTYSRLGEALQKQTEKQINALKISKYF